MFRPATTEASRKRTAGRVRVPRRTRSSETSSTNPAGLNYRSLGFEPETGNAQAYRKPPR